MSLDIEGCRSQSLIEYIEKVAEYLGLNDDRYIDSLIIVEFVKECDGFASGYCYGDAELVNVEIARNDACGKIPLAQLKRNIAHELIHAKQIVSGRLVNKGFVIRDDEWVYVWEWEGVEFIDTPDSEQPWQIEAYALEKKVCNNA